MFWKLSHGLNQLAERIRCLYGKKPVEEKKTRCYITFLWAQMVNAKKSYPTDKSRIGTRIIQTRQHLSPSFY